MPNTATNHPSRRATDAARLPQTLVFEDDPVREQLERALKDATRIIQTALIEGQLRTDTEVQKQNKADASGLIGGFKRALLEAGVPA